MAPPTHPPTAKKPLPVTQIILSVLGFILFFGTIILFVSLAMDKITIPYLTPFAHFLVLAFSPFLPFIFPAHLGLFMKVYRYKAGQVSRTKPHDVRGEWKGKRTWVLVTGSWVFQHLGRVTGDFARLMYGGVSGKVGKGVAWRKVDVCSVGTCKGPWVEAVVTVLVVVAEMRGWKWEGGLFDRWVEVMVVQSVGRSEESAEVERMEGGVGGEEEKEGLLVGGESSVLDEKTPLQEKA